MRRSTAPFPALSGQDDRSRLTAARRAADIEHLASGAVVDVLVVGGGVTGAGVALDAASRGLTVALLERADLATGTSRWSSKLVHGGLRYLAHGQLDVAWESARERAILLERTAPHLIRPLPWVIPFGPNVSALGDRAIAAGIRAGDLLRAAAGTSRRRLPAARRISAEEARRWAPRLDPRDLRGGLLHWDGQLEDDARLVVALARTAAAHGARIVTHAPVTEITAGGARATDALTGEAFEVRARHVVNATGVWADRLVKGVRLRPSKGAHLILPAGLLGDPRAAISVPVPGAFGRFVFALPRNDGHVLLGLTDEPYDGDPVDAPPVSDAEERELLDVFGTVLDVEIGPDDVVGRFAGLRPLLDAEGRTADLSRRHAVIEDEDTGALSIVGGKLTTYRRMAQDVVDRIAARPGVAAGPCRTRDLPLVGAGPRPDGELPPRLVRRYGAEAPLVAEAGPLTPVAPGVPVLEAELAWAARAELALTPGDVCRRVRADLLDEWAAAVRPRAEALTAARAERRRRARDEPGPSDMWEGRRTGPPRDDVSA